MNDQSHNNYYINLYLTKYPIDFLKKLTDATNTYEVASLLDLFNHPETIEYELYFQEDFQFETQEHFERFQEKVVNGFITVDDLFGILLYLNSEENAHYYQTNPYKASSLSILFARVNELIINNYENRLIAVQYDEY